MRRYPVNTWTNWWSWTRRKEGRGCSSQTLSVSSWLTGMLADTTLFFWTKFSLWPTLSSFAYIDLYLSISCFECRHMIIDSQNMHIAQCSFSFNWKFSENSIIFKKKRWHFHFLFSNIVFFSARLYRIEWKYLDYFCFNIW